MIHRIADIKGIGKFDRPNAVGACQFAKNTIIFGPNAEGKTTITDILRSFKTGNGDLIRGRKRFGFNDVQAVTIYDSAGNRFTFPSDEWNLGRNNIEIFDTQFIDENIFEGHEVSFD